MMTTALNGFQSPIHKPHRPSVGEIEAGVAALAQRVEGLIDALGRNVPLSAATRDQITALVIGEVLTDLGIRNEEQLELPLGA